MLLLLLSMCEIMFLLTFPVCGSHLFLSRTNKAHQVIFSLCFWSTFYQGEQRYCCLTLEIFNWLDWTVDLGLIRLCRDLNFCPESHQVLVYGLFLMIAAQDPSENWTVVVPEHGWRLLDWTLWILIISLYNKITCWFVYIRVLNPSSAQCGCCNSPCRVSVMVSLSQVFFLFLRRRHFAADCLVWHL